MFGSRQRVDYTGFDYRFQMQNSATMALSALFFALSASFARFVPSWPPRRRYALYGFGHLLIFAGLVSCVESWIEATATGLCVSMLASISAVLLAPFIQKRTRSGAGLFLLLGFGLLLWEMTR